MRIFLFLTLGALVIGAIIYALRLLWRTAHPPTKEVEAENPVSWIESGSGRVILYLAAALLGMMVILQIVETPEKPAKNYTPSQFVDGKIKPGKLE